MEHSILIKNIREHIMLSKEEEEIILAKTRIENFAKKVILENSYSTYRNIYFVNKGCIQLCVVNDNGIEKTVQFSINNLWLTDFDSFNYQKESFYELKTVSDSEVVMISYSVLSNLRYEIPQLEKYFRIVAERAYSASLYRIYLMMNLSKEDRYLHYVQTFPKFSKHVPQFILASYLGLSPEYLSEIKNKVIKS